MLGFGRRTPLDLLASFLGAHPVLRSLLVLPVRNAREGGDLLFALHILLLGAAGVAFAALVQGLDLSRAVVPAALYELSAAADGITGWQLLAVLCATPLFLASLERVLRHHPPSIGRLAGSIALLASLAGTRTAELTFGFGVVWAGIRLVTTSVTRRLAAVWRLLFGALLGTLLAAPLLVPRLLYRAVGADVTWPEPVQWLPSWELIASHPGVRLPLIVLLLPAFSLACLGLTGARGRTLRVLLALVVAASGALAIDPLMLAGLAILCAIALNDLAANAADKRVSLAIAVVLITAGLGVAFAGCAPPWLALANCAATLATLALAIRAGQRALASLPALAAASWSALAAAS